MAMLVAEHAQELNGKVAVAAVLARQEPRLVPLVATVVLAGNTIFLEL
jgi:hypothetical protein